MQISNKIMGNVYKGQFLEFEKSKGRIGKGGNGEVYLIKIINDQALIKKNGHNFLVACYYSFI